MIANGVLVDRSKHRGRATTHWRADEPMASYLAFFAAGSFETRSGSYNGRPYYVAVSNAVPEPLHKDAMTLMLRSGEITAWLESQLGTYPFSTTGRPGHLAPGHLRAGEPDPADLPRGRLGQRPAGRARAGAPVVRRLGLGPRAGATSGSTRASRSSCRPTTPRPTAGRPTQSWLHRDLRPLPAVPGVLEAAHRRPRPPAPLRHPDLRPRRDDRPGAPAPDRRRRVLAAAAHLGGPAPLRQRLDPGVRGARHVDQRPGPHVVLRRLAAPEDAAGQDRRQRAALIRL